MKWFSKFFRMFKKKPTFNTSLVYTAPVDGIYEVSGHVTTSRGIRKVSVIVEAKDVQDAYEKVADKLMEDL